MHARIICPQFRLGPERLRLRRQRYADKPQVVVDAARERAQRKDYPHLAGLPWDATMASRCLSPQPRERLGFELPRWSLSQTPLSCSDSWSATDAQQPSVPARGQGPACKRPRRSSPACSAACCRQAHGRILCPRNTRRCRRRRPTSPSLFGATSVSARSRSRPKCVRALVRPHGERVQHLRDPAPLAANSKGSAVRAIPVETPGSSEHASAARHDTLECFVQAHNVLPLGTPGQFAV